MAKNRDDDLLKKLRMLEMEKAELEKRLQAKRYKMIDKVVDTSYRVLRFGRPSTNKTAPSARIRKAPAKKVSKARTRDNIDKGRVDIINVNFYDWNGETVFLGGAERYVYDLACLLKKMGYRPRLLQGANKNFCKDYEGIEVRGIKSAEPNMETLSAKFAQICKDAELVIASPLELACRINTGVPIIAINHGVNFDHPQTTFENTNSGAYRLYEKALLNTTRCVCVDTNFINWVRTKEYALSEKLCYIPNYYDATLFHSHQRNADKAVHFVYPRRIYEARGADITIEAFTRLLKKYPGKIDLTWVGQVDNEEIGKKLDKMLKQFPQQVEHQEFEPQEMYKAYEKADVVLIPTRYSEGTSLSCIEGMASGAAIIATTVGGLPNLIVDGFNGLLINPTAKALENAAEKMIVEPNLLQTIAKNATKVAKAGFRKDSWDTRWQAEISETLSK